MSKYEVGSKDYLETAMWGFILHCGAGNFEKALEFGKGSSPCKNNIGNYRFDFDFS